MQPHVDILLFGGAFDPPHIGHTTVVEQVLIQKFADQVVLMPVGQHPFSKMLSSAEYRLELLKIAFNSLFSQFPDRLLVDTFEISQQNTTYTYDSLLYLQKKYPRKTLGLLIGSDNVAKFDSWKFSDEIKKICTIFVYPRLGFPVDDESKLLKSVSQVESSSTEIRELIGDSAQSANSEKLKKNLDLAVLHYILKHNLYQKRGDHERGHNN